MAKPCGTLAGLLWWDYRGLCPRSDEGGSQLEPYLPFLSTVDDLKEQ